MRERKRAYSIHGNIIGRATGNGGNQATGVAVETAPTLTKTDRHAVMHLAHVFKERGGVPVVVRVTSALTSLRSHFQQVKTKQLCSQFYSDLTA